MTEAELRDLLDTVRKRYKIAGAQAAFYDDGEFISVSSGIANRLTGVEMTDDTLVQIGSTTKLFTAVLVMMLVDDRLVDLDQPIGTYLPNLAFPDEVSSTVTVRHLLSMSAGIDNGPYIDLGNGNDVVRRYAELLVDLPLLFPPGSAFGYSNACTSLAALLAESLTGTPWHILLQERLCQLAGLDVETEPANLLIRRTAIGHAPGSDGSRVPLRRWALGKAQGPTGGSLCSSAATLVQLATVFLNSGTASNGKRVLSPDSVATMHTPQVGCATKLVATHWGVGPFITSWDGVSIHGHLGTNIGGSSMLLWSPQRRFAIATTVNTAQCGQPLANDVFDIVFPERFGISRPSTPTAGRTGLHIDAHAYVGTYERHGVKNEITDGGDGTLWLTKTIAANSARGIAENTVIECALEPLGDHRFLPMNPDVSSNRMWDFAFFNFDEDGKARNAINGIFASRRSPEYALA